MASNTPNYALKKPAATDFYTVEDQNANMDKLDAALKGLADGKAPAAHAAQHGAGGSDPVTPGSIGAATAQYSTYTSLSDLLTVPSGFYTVYPPAVNMPMVGYWYCIVCAEQPSSGTRIIYAMPGGIINESLWKIKCTGGVPEIWKEIATATPPAEYDLPLADGVTLFTGLYAKYYKNQFGEVTISADLLGSFVSGSGVLLATVPVGFRPSSYIEIPADFAHVAGRVQIGTDGQIFAINNCGETKSAVAFSVSFIAGN